MYFLRGPYKIIRGKLIINYKNWNRLYLDSFRILVIFAIIFFEFDKDVILIILISLLIISDLIRTWESFENIYKSTHHIVFVV